MITAQELIGSECDIADEQKLTEQEARQLLEAMRTAVASVPTSSFVEKLARAWSAELELEIEVGEQFQDGLLTEPEARRIRRGEQL